MPFSLANVFRTIGPGAILLAASIGGGEWLVGPATTVRFGPGVLWIATTAIVLQLMFNLEGIRYTLYTGEPILTGILRLRPGPGCWSSVYIALTFAQLGLPALAAACAPAIFSAFVGHIPTDADDVALKGLTYAVILVAVVILVSGRTIERVLEVASWFMITYIFIFLTAVNIIVVPWSNWLATLGGFFEFGTIPQGVDLVLLGSLAATAGSGGIGNLVISNWVRDKGFGMGAKVGAIGGAFSSQEVRLSHVGKIFPITPENLRRWRLWWKYVVIDQIWLWAAGCFLGMFLNVNLATYVIAPGTNLEGIAAGAYQAEHLTAIWAGFWFLALLNGFWILFSTHLGNTDCLIRTITDVLWVSNDRIRGWKSASVGKVYTFLLVGLTAWGMLGVGWGNAMDLFKVLAIVANPILCMASIQVLRINTTLLPPELRPGIWRRGALVAAAMFYGFVTLALIWDLGHKFKVW